MLRLFMSCFFIIIMLNYIIFEDTVPHQALFTTLDSGNNIFKYPYLHFFPSNLVGSYKVTLAYYNPQTKEYAYPYYEGTCIEAQDCFFVNPKDSSDILILNVGTCYQNDERVMKIQKAINKLYGDMQL